MAKYLLQVSYLVDEVNGLLKEGWDIQKNHCVKISRVYGRFSGSFLLWIWR